MPAWEVIRCNLKLLAGIKERDKLIIAGDTVRIDSPGENGQRWGRGKWDGYGAGKGWEAMQMIYVDLLLMIDTSESTLGRLRPRSAPHGLSFRV